MVRLASMLALNDCKSAGHPLCTCKPARRPRPWRNVSTAPLPLTACTSSATIAACPISIRALHRLRIFRQCSATAVSFGYEDLSALPASQQGSLFIECSGNSYRQHLRPQPWIKAQVNSTGSYLLRRVDRCPADGNCCLRRQGTIPKSDWVVAEGADAAGMNRSVTASRLSA